MSKKLFLPFISCITALFIWLISCTNQQTKSVALTVSVASSYKDAIQEIDQIYKQEKPNISINYNINGGGILRKQITLGAPIDVFIAASAKHMDLLQDKNLILTDTRKELAKNQMVLIAEKNSNSINNFKDLATDKVKKVALGSENIDAGVYTKQLLTSLNIYDQVKSKGVFEENDVQQVVKIVVTKGADVGITFLTEAKRSDQVKIIDTARENSHTPAISNIAVIRGSKNITEAKEFIQLLKSAKAAPIFEKYGFVMVE